MLRGTIYVETQKKHDISHEYINNSFYL